MVMNAKNLQRFGKGIELIRHVCIGAQIVILISVFICALSVALSVFQNHALDFMNPYINFLKDITSYIFSGEVKSTHPDIDGRAVLFVLFGIILAFFISQLKMACQSFLESIAAKVVETKKVEEDLFNRDLNNNLEQFIMEQSNFVIAAQIRVKSLIKDGFSSKMPTPEELEQIKFEVITKFFEKLKTTAGLKFSKDEDILLISSNNINNFDIALAQIWNVFTKLKEEYKLKQISPRIKMAVESYRPSTPMPTAYKTIRPLLNLNAQNEVLCYGNFKNRYDLKKNNIFNFTLKGKYDMKGTDEDTVWSIVNKN